MRLSIGKYRCGIFFKNITETKLNKNKYKSDKKLKH